MAAAKKLFVLRHRAEFLAVAKTGKKFVAPSFILQFGEVRQAPVPEGDVARYGLTATTKIGNAVVRNRARRRLRALASEILSAHADTKRDYVLIARNTTGAADYADMKNDLVKALKKMDAYRE